jgi:hypothetical protein
LSRSFESTVCCFPAGDGLCKVRRDQADPVLHRKAADTGPATVSTVFHNGRVIEEHNTSPLNNISPAGSFILAFTNITDNSSLADFALMAQHV